MCIVIDINVFPIVFDSRHKEHSKFIDLFRWITTGRGFIVFGGTHYLKELKGIRSYLRFITELDRSGRTRRLIDELVDKEEKLVQKIINSNDCDDCHLIAIVRVSGCRLICSNDRRADKYLKNGKYYPKQQKAPHIYRDNSHKRLLCNKNICDIKNVK